MKLTRTVKENIRAALWKRSYRNVRFLANGDVVGRLNDGLAEVSLIANTRFMDECEVYDLAPFVIEVQNVVVGGAYQYLTAFTETEEKSVYEKVKARYNDPEIWKIVRFNRMTGRTIKE